MEKIKKVSKIFRWLFIIGMGITPILSIAIWIPFDPQDPSSFSMLPFSAYDLRIQAPFPLSSKLLAILVTFIPAAIQMVAYYFLTKLFMLYENGDIFTLENIRYIKKAGYAFLIGQLASPLVNALLSVVLTMHQEKKSLRLEFSFNQGLVFIAILITVVSWVMEEGQKLKMQDDLTI